LTGVLFVIALALSLVGTASAENNWAVGNLVGLCTGTKIHTGPGDSYPVHTTVPEDNWTVKVIDGPRYADGQTWWDTSRFAAGDPSGGTGWVSQSQVGNCSSSDGGGGDTGGGDTGGGGSGGFVCPNWVSPGITYFNKSTPRIYTGYVNYIVEYSAQLTGQYCGSRLSLTGGKEFELAGGIGTLTFNDKYQITGTGFNIGNGASEFIYGFTGAKSDYPGDPYFGNRITQTVVKEQIIDFKNTNEIKNIFNFNRPAIALVLVIAASVFVVYVMAAAVATIGAAGLAEFATVMTLWFTQVTGGAPAPVLQQASFAQPLRMAASSQIFKMPMMNTVAVQPSQNAIDLFTQQYGAMAQWADLIGLSPEKDKVSAYTEFKITGGGFTPNTEVYYEFGLPGHAPIFQDVVTANASGEIHVQIEMPVPDQTPLGTYLIAAFDYATINQTMLGALDADVNPSHFTVAVATVEVVEDVTPPTILITSPTAMPYDRCDQPVARFEVTDDLSGVASVNASIDQAPIADDANLDMLFWNLGNHTLAVQAFDKVGWEQNERMTLELQATIQGTKCALDSFKSLSLLKTNGIYTSINTHLDAADRALENNKISGARQALTSILKVLEAQKKQIDPTAYNILIMDIHALLSSPIR
jgi:hypothetical protein